MKELTIEQKAKAYDEALERAEKALEVFGTDKCEGARQIFSLFPELVESEDEKIRKTLIEYFNAYPKDYYGELKKSHILAWLEKQSEKKSTWSEEDESYLNATIAYLKDAKEFKKTAENCITWLKSLKERCAWKPNDEQLKAIKWIMDGDNPENWTVTLTNLYNDLKKL